MICPGCGARFDDTDACGLCGTAAPDPPALAIDAYENLNRLFEGIRKWDPNVALDDLGPSVECAAWLIARVRDSVEALRLADATLTAFVADIIPPRSPYEVDGVGAVTVQFGSTRKEWDTPGLISQAVASICEGDVEEIDRVRPTIDAFLVFARPDWRVTPFKERGVDLDNYCTRTPGLPRVVIE